MHRKYLHCFTIVLLILDCCCIYIISTFASNKSIIDGQTSEVRVENSSDYAFNIENRTFLMGMNPHPKQYQDDSLTEEEIAININAAYELGKNCMELFPTWPAVDWFSASTEISETTLEFYRDNLGWQPMIYLDIINYSYVPSTEVWQVTPLLSSTQTAGLKWNDSQYVDDVSNALINLCKRDRGPKIVFLGNEINQVYELADLEAFLELAEAINNIIMCVHASPEVPDDVLFGTVLSHTQMLVNISDNTLWTQDRLWMLEKFSQVDILGINSYPFKSGYADPIDISADYYTNISDYTDKPLWFTEIAWPSSVTYGSSEIEQASFLSHFVNLTQNLDIQALCWISMHDFAEADGAEDHVLSWGLRTSLSEEKEVWDMWTDLKNLKIVGSMRNYLESIVLPTGLTMDHIFLIIFGVSGVVFVVVAIKKKQS